ncbi:MAG: sigma-70 family RNA polymerase sigma factor [Planctomycetes bacterium]|nr:sigma-70 family RNA polymerase sigma factor [Planctomycetota bacterium]
MERISQHLIEGLRAGEADAYRCVVELFERPLLNFIERSVGNPALAEDLFQETFVRVVQALPAYEPRAAFSTWVFTIARNLCLDYHKHQRLVRQVSLDAPVAEDGGGVIPFSEALAARQQAPDEAAAAREEATRLREAIATLSPILRESLILRVYNRLSYEEIAEIVEAPVGTVKFRVHDAVRQLGKALGVKAAEAPPGEERRIREA